MMKSMRSSKRAFVLILCIWLIIIVTLVVLQMVRQSSLEMSQNQAVAGVARARWAALAGVQYAISVLIEDDRKVDCLSERIYDDQSFRNHQLGDDLSFSVGGGNISEPVRYGLYDEASKLNLFSLIQNTDTPSGFNGNMLVQQATSLAGRLGEIAGFDPSAPIPDIGQIAETEDLTLADAWGEDVNLNYMLDWNEDDGSIAFPPDNSDGVLQDGLLHYLTVSSFQENSDGQGRPRLNINTASATELAALGLLTQANILWVIENRPYVSRGELFSQNISPADFTQPITEARRKARQNAVKADQAALRQNNNGQKPIIPQPPTAEVVRMLFDQVTVSENHYLLGQVNINIAGSEVIAAITGLDSTAASTLAGYRDGLANGFDSEADIFAAGVMNYEQMVNVVEKLTLRSNVFTIVSTGSCGRTNRHYQIQVMISRYKLPGSQAQYHILRQTGSPWLGDVVE